MGTNYYVVPNRPSRMEPIHIGKSSAGWLFNFNDQDQPWNDPPVVWHTYGQVMDWLRKWTVENPVYAIIDEYDEIIPFEKFKEKVDAKQSDPRSLANPDNFQFSKNVDGYRFMEGEFR